MNQGTARVILPLGESNCLDRWNYKDDMGYTWM